jgi:hypothetical protein
MRRILFSCLAASVLSGGPAFAAEAAMLAAPMPGLGDTQLVQRVANVCGANGCVRVQTQRVQHQKPGSAAAKHI